MVVETGRQPYGFVNTTTLGGITEELKVHFKGGISVKLVFIFLFFTVLVSACNSYSLEDAEKNGDLITGLGEMNYVKIDEFMNDVKK